MAKLMLILLFFGACADKVASTNSKPPLLIQDTTAAPLDAAK